MQQWPPRYVPVAGISLAPNLSVSQSIDAGRALAQILIAEPGYVVRYLTFVKLFFLFPTRDRTAEFATLIASALPKTRGSLDASNLNEHDCANIHRAAWLLVLRGLARLTAFHPFRSPYNQNPYADPTVGGTERHVEMATRRGTFLFQIPNGIGHYALANSDIDDEEKVRMGELASEDDIPIVTRTRAPHD